MKHIITLITLIVLAAPGAWAQSKKSKRKATTVTASSTKTIDMNNQFDGLGSNEEIIKKAQALQPQNSMRIVQKRAVDRTWRGELGASFGFVDGGDSYINTRNWGVNADLHISPRWSIGARYIDNKNELTSEGKLLYDTAKAKIANGESDYIIPEIDFPLRTMMAVVNWYPIYGKVSWFESAVSQFDFYVLAGGGQVQLQSGDSVIYTGGVGMGMWWNNWLTSRFEVRYQNYKDRVSTGERNIDGFVAQIGIGIML